MRGKHNPPKHQALHQGTQKQTGQDGQRDGQGVTHFIDGLQREEDKRAQHDTFAMRKVQNRRGLDQGGHAHGNNRIATSDDKPTDQNLKKHRRCLHVRAPCTPLASCWSRSGHGPAALTA